MTHHILSTSTRLVLRLQIQRQQRTIRSSCGISLTRCSRKYVPFPTSWIQHRVASSKHNSSAHFPLSESEWDEARSVAKRIVEYAGTIEEEIVKARKHSPAEVSSLYEKQASLLDALAAVEQLEIGYKDWLDLLELSNSDDHELAELAQEDLRLYQAETQRTLCARVVRSWEAVDAHKQKAVEPGADPNICEDQVVLEFRPGVGGEEAALFTKDLVRAYKLLSGAQGWRMVPLSESKTDVVARVEGAGSARVLRHEGGVHRVQRVPKTEKNGKVHTSTVSVAVLPVAKAGLPGALALDPRDLKVEVFRASGAGGQHVNTTESAVRITHLPTGQAASIQDERSQHANKQKAMALLTSRVAAVAREAEVAGVRDLRRTQIGTAGRNERIRTYNFAQNRVTDHRSGTTIHALDSILDGNPKAWDELLGEVSRGLRDSNV